MKYKIIADSGSNVTTLADTDFASVPITIMAGGKEYIDDAALDVLAMTDELRKLSTKSSTACPNIDQWLTASRTPSRSVAGPSVQTIFVFRIIYTTFLNGNRFSTF